MVQNNEKWCQMVLHGAGWRQMLQVQQDGARWCTVMKYRVRRGGMGREEGQARGGEKR